MNRPVSGRVYKWNDVTMLECVARVWYKVIHATDDSREYCAVRSDDIPFALNRRFCTALTWRYP
jgi:hypothetical protein